MRQESNPQPSVYKTEALPVELLMQFRGFRTPESVYAASLTGALNIETILPVKAY
jgi:hypothetical protein